MNPDLPQPVTPQPPVHAPAPQIPSELAPLPVPEIPKTSRPNPLSRLKSFVSSIKIKKGEESPVSPTTKMSIKRLVILIAAIFFVIIMVAVAFKLLTNKSAVIVPTPTPTPTATPEVLVPSAYADDEDVLAIEAALDYLEGELKIVSLRDDEIAIPLLDWEVSFEK